MEGGAVYIAKKANNFDILRDFYETFLASSSNIGRHLDIGHRKNLRFARTISINHTEGEVVYYDNRDFIEKLIGTFKVGEKRKKLPEKLKLTSSPEGCFDSASYFLTIHEFEEKISPAESLRETYGFLRDNGRVVVVDYDLGWIKNEEHPDKVLKEIFNSKNEKDVIEQEKDWFEAHTRYSLEKCVQDAGLVGFRTLHQETKGNKLFLYIGEK